jgi:tRNA(fMet)-specific endonuclease VapC
MTPVVVDTDVVSFIFKRDTRSQLYLAHVDGKPGMISFMTEAELERWGLEAAWGDLRRTRLREFLKRFLIVPSSEMLSRKWAAVMFQARSSGRRMETADAWIAATALLYVAPLVTNNPSDCSGAPGLQIIMHFPS